MSYNTGIPNANQSPGLFPAQANTNFLRIQQIVERDHFFLLASDPLEGAHKQVSFLNMTNPTDPSVLTSVNGILYAKQVDGKSQLFWFNGSDYYEITPPLVPPPTSGVQKVTGTITVPSGGSLPVYTSSGKVQMTAFGNRTDNILKRSYYLLYNSPTSFTSDKLFSADINYPDFLWSGFDLVIKNTSPLAQTFDYFLTIVQL